MNLESKTIEELLEMYSYEHENGYDDSKITEITEELKDIGVTQDTLNLLIKNKTKVFKSAFNF